MPRIKPTQTERLEIQLAIEKVKLAKLQSELPPPPSPYVRYKDLRPPTPEERDRFYVRLRKLVNELLAEAKQEKYDWYMSCLLYTSPSPRDLSTSRMPSSA